MLGNITEYNVQPLFGKDSKGWYIEDYESDLIIGLEPTQMLLERASLGPKLELSCLPPITTAVPFDRVKSTLQLFNCPVWETKPKRPKHTLEPTRQRVFEGVEIRQRLEHAFLDRFLSVFRCHPVEYVLSLYLSEPTNALRNALHADHMPYEGELQMTGCYDIHESLDKLVEACAAIKRNPKPFVEIKYKNLVHESVVYGHFYPLTEPMILALGVWTNETLGVELTYQRIMYVCGLIGPRGGALKGWRVNKGYREARWLLGSRRSVQSAIYYNLVSRLP
jgi:hypothetical protein